MDQLKHIQIRPRAHLNPTFLTFIDDIAISTDYPDIYSATIVLSALVLCLPRTTLQPIDNHFLSCNNDFSSPNQTWIVLRHCIGLELGFFMFLSPTVSVSGSFPRSESLVLL